MTTVIFSTISGDIFTSYLHFCKNMNFVNQKSHEIPIKKNNATLVGQKRLMNHNNTVV